MGTVYEAVHVVLPRRAAIKVLHRHLLDKWAARERLFQEARILEELDHPGVVKIYDVGVLDDERPWIAMELLEGLTVAQRLTVRGKLDALEVIDLLDRALAALEVAHRAGVIHRDLKPENIVLCRTSCGPAVRVIDWGIARVAAEPPGRFTRTNMTLGTPLYMSPEQARGKHLDGASDVYALGVIAYEVLTGLPPFTGDSPLDVVIQHLTVPPPPLRTRRAEVPASLDRLVLAMLEKEPRRRPSIGAIRAELAVIADDLRDASYEEVSIELEIEIDDDVDTSPYLAGPRWTPLAQPIVPRPGHLAVAGEIGARGLDRHTERQNLAPVAGEAANPATSPGVRVARDLH
jgi:serine/threonine-protein kinase